MERGCHSDRCRGRDFHIVRKRKKLGRKTKVQMRRNRAFYSKWSRWTPCTDLCLTTRAKSCKYAAVCGKVQVKRVIEPFILKGTSYIKDYAVIML